MSTLPCDDQMLTDVVCHCACVLRSSPMQSITCRCVLIDTVLTQIAYSIVLKSQSSLTCFCILQMHLMSIPHMLVSALDETQLVALKTNLWAKSAPDRDKWRQ